MKPIGFKKTRYTFIDMKMFKLNMRHANAGSRAARKNCKILVRKAKHSENNEIKRQIYD
jgi:hypothetical protein